VKVEEITENDTSELELFLSLCGKSLSTFRYFLTRELECVANHIVTLLFYKDRTPVAYGHLDREGQETWLGVCVIDAEIGNGYGEAMTRELLNRAKKHEIAKIRLSVDEQNEAARCLYKKLGFLLNKTKDGVCYMEFGGGDRV
jgi:GNAT superfamily N-acetyltransferase